MAEYICREAIIEDLEKKIEAGNVALDEDVWINKGIKIAIRDIKDSKTADVQPVKHGKWILEKQPDGAPYCFHCSVCDVDFRKIYIRTKYDYCPDCGARMDGD